MKIQYKYIYRYLAIAASILLVEVPVNAEQTTRLKGAEVALSGTLPQVGQQAPDFRLVDVDLSEVTLDTYAGKNKIISIVPSLDTRVCALSAKKFNEEINDRADTVLLNVSVDLPFAAKRFCEAEGLENIQALSAFRAPHFGRQYGVRIEEGEFRGLLARAVVVLDTSNTVVYSELVPDISHEPMYEKILNSLN